MYNIRKATVADVPGITEIYNEAIANTVATFDTETKTVDNREVWFHGHGPKHPVLVAVQDAKVLGFASLNPYSDRQAYENTVELSLYIHADHRGQGIGKALMEQVLEAGREAGLHTVLSRIVAGNDSSIHLHEVFGFDHVGIMREVGFKFGSLLDVYLMQKIYK
ncbi:GNAT family N-acetyltransferase [Paenibacillus thalictri]|uniref:N-acetyltransferase family protein n=1 Tax=Paenibacillus thalictri TaxID=2527873 RepID=A0A4Q9DMC8_9BACL|nr:GNAT family N-acetyltransferase [Paenibacillus thalictri]TBL73343.1 N-acetyltransferase family protein [Paenibacillus thalictri]